MNKVPSCLPGRWVHSWEEDTESTRTYRPSSWSLPQSRSPRQVLELEPDGRIVSRVGGPADSRIAREGRWNIEWNESSVLRIDWQDTPQPTVIDVINCSKEVLQVRLVNGTIE